MKKLALFLAATMVCAGSAWAADVVELPASMGKVTFPHKKHQEMLKDCTKCHEQGPGKIADLGKEWAHKTCKQCHTDLGKGPTTCKGCHKK